MHQIVGAPQVSVVPLSSKLKDIPVHVIVNPSDVRGYNLRNQSDFMPEDTQTLAKGCIRSKSGYIPKDSAVREAIDRALIMQFDLLPVARKMVLEEIQNEGAKKGKEICKICRGSRVFDGLVKVSGAGKGCKSLLNKLNHMVLVNLDLIDEYLETFRITDEDFYK